MCLHWSPRISITKCKCKIFLNYFVFWISCKCLLIFDVFYTLTWNLCRDKLYKILTFWKVGAHAKWTGQMMTTVTQQKHKGLTLHLFQNQVYLFPKNKSGPMHALTVFVSIMLKFQLTSIVNIVYLNNLFLNSHTWNIPYKCPSQISNESNFDWYP